MMSKIGRNFVYFGLFYACIFLKNADGQYPDCAPDPSITNGKAIPVGGDISYGAIAVIICDTGYNATTLNITCTANGTWEYAQCEIIGCGDPRNISHGNITLDNKHNTSVGALANVTCVTGYTSNTTVLECMSTGKWHKNATCKPVDCGSVPSITNGTVTLLNSTNTTYGAKAMVNCSSGYNATIKNITCLASGVWDNSSVCVQNGSCPVPQNISYGKITLDSKHNTSVGALANVTCDTGYETNTTIIECMSTGKWNENATCKPVDCGSVPSITNGTITLLNSTNTTYGAKAMVNCSSGYNATIKNITCLASGVWDNSSVCVQNGSCPVPQNISHGKITLDSKHNTSVGALANVTCDKGYETNTTIIECMSTGKWNENATCKPVDCGSVPSITNGTITLLNSTNTTYGAKAMVNCSSGYNATIKNITCLASGVWDNSSVCVQNGSCPVPQNISHGKITLDSKHNTSVGALANVTCDKGYETNTTIIECMSTGKWNENATCKPVDCGSVPSITNGTITLLNSTNTTYGAKAMVNCSSGYNATIKNITCLASGVWDNSSVCVQNGSCPVPQNISHGKITLDSKHNTSVGALANVTCDKGYETNTTIIECMSTGKWNENATCKPVDCGSVPSITNGTITLLNSTNTTYGAKAMVNCSSGYNATIKNITCLASGVWDNSSVCVQNGSCPVPQNISHGKITLDSKHNTSVGALANVTCDKGYETNTTIIECMSTGKWNENATCKPVDCGSVPSITNGTITLLNSTNTTYGAKAMVNCSSGYNATIKNITCLASGVWDNSSVCVQNGSCPVPQNISHGKITLDSKHNTSVGALANVTCDKGYETNTTIIECMSTGKWNENATCKPVDCGSVPSITNGTITLLNSTNTTYGAKAMVNCSSGYNATIKNITCLASGVWDNSSVCVQNGSCPVPQNISHGKITLDSKHNTSVGALANVTCDKGYETNTTIIECMSTGKWNENATCKPVDCGSVPSITNGTITLLNSTNTTYGAKAMVNCSSGYNATIKNITCLASGVWDNSSVCVQNGSCPVPQNISHGKITLDSKHNTSVGALANVTCDKGYETNTTIIECMSTGKWNENATCKPVDCGSVPSITNGTITLLNSTNTTYGAKAMVNCSSGYNATIKNITCLASGVWDNSSVCVQNGSCPVPQNISHGKITLDSKHNTSVGALANVTCDKGYETNTTIIECMSTGKWNENATCKPVDCGSVPSITNGTITLLNSTNTTYGAKAMVNCSSGYNATIKNITCLASGVWDNSSVCVQNGSCPVPKNISHGKITLDSKHNTSVGALANVTCDKGYETNTTIIECMSTGKWNENATCKPVDCGSVPSITNGTITLLNSTNTTYGAKAMVNCSSGYNATIKNITCLASGVWDNSSVCVQNGSCAVPQNILHGKITLNSQRNTSVGALANVTCDTGYKSNTTVIECISTGKWNKTATCKPVDCGPVPDVDHGEVILDSKYNSSYGSIALVECDEGYTALTDQLTCLENGQWEDWESFAECSAIECALVPNITNGEAILDDGDNTYGALAVIKCDNGYNTTTLNITCTANGTWEYAECEIMGCGDPRNISHGDITLDSEHNTSVGALANVTCDIGYKSNTTILKCMSSGKWHKNATCKLVDCGSVPSIVNGSITLHNSTNTTYGAKAMVNCSSGYNATIKNITCLASGIWDNSSVCVKNGSCPVPQNILHGKITLNSQRNTSIGALANVTCDTGYKSNTTVIECISTGKWNKTATCKPVDCGPVPDVDHGEVILDSKYNSSYGSIALVECDEGYTALTDQLTCFENGQWEDWESFAECSAIECALVPNITNGEAILDDGDNTYGALAVIKCDNGHNTTTLNITCTANGTWEYAECEIMGCGDPRNISHGNITLDSEHNTSVGALANVTCDIGYKSNTTILECMSTGKWHKNATCKPVDCGSVPSITNGTITLHNSTNTTYGAKAIVNCSSGYNATIKNITCLASGIWDNSSVCVQNGSCTIPQNISYGKITLDSKHNTSVGALANVTCNTGYETNTTSIECMSTGKWNKNSTCKPVDCGSVPSITNGSITLHNSTNTTYGAKAMVNCSSGYNATLKNITCLASGVWDNSSVCVQNGSCAVPQNISHVKITLNSQRNTSIGALANVTCDTGYKSNTTVIECISTGKWNETATCKPVGLGIVKVEAGQDVSDIQHSAYLKCSFLVILDLTYRVKWDYNGYQFLETDIVDGEQIEDHKLTDDDIMDINNVVSFHILGARIKCTVLVYDSIGAVELESKTSAEFVPIGVSNTDLSFKRNESSTFTIVLNIPFGCPLSSSECCLRFIVHDPNEDHSCSDSTLAVFSNDTSGGKICMYNASPANFTTVINITITTKNNRYYRLRSDFYPVVTMSALGNSKSIWNEILTDVYVNVKDDYALKYRGCYSFVDPYFYTFDGRYFSFQEKGIFVLFRHTKLPIEVQIKTAPCNGGWATCACAVAVRAGGDLYAIDHCGGHKTGYLSQKDGILRVYKWYTNYYQIVLPTGMVVYAYVMPYFDYSMNVYIIPAPSDFGYSSGLCGNYNGDRDDDTMLRGTNQVSEVEASRGIGDWWWWWPWDSDYFYPDDFAFSWGLINTKRMDEYLLNQDVYTSLSLWPEDKKLCVFTDDTQGVTPRSLCSADEEATCLGPTYWRYGTLVTNSMRGKRAAEMYTGSAKESNKRTAKRLNKMYGKWIQALDKKDHNILKRQVDNASNITMDTCRDMCEDALSKCHSYTKKDNVSDVAAFEDNLENCAKDCLVSGNADWSEAHCAAFTLKVKVEIDKDKEFSDNHTELVKDIEDNACPGNCSSNGDCLEGRCVCYDGYGTDLCLINLVIPPILEEYGDEGICDIGTDGSCDFILVVGDGFVEDGWCNVTVYVAYAVGQFEYSDQFVTPCIYENFNEIYVPTVNPSVRRRRRDAENEDPVFAWMYGISISHDGTNYGELKYVAVMDTSCQQTDGSTSESSQILLKQGSCYINGSCYNDGAFRTGSICDSCDTSSKVFEWTYVCDPGTDEDDQRLAIIIGTVCGTVVLIGAVVGFVFYKKYKSFSPKMPDQPNMQSNTKFWLKRTSLIDPMEKTHVESWLVPRRKSVGIGVSDDADGWN